MTKDDLRIIFMGTPEFAVASLKAIVEAGYNVVAVITAPDKPAGRGQKLSESPVKVYARSKGIKILQPVNLKNEVFLDELRSLQAQLQVVVAFRMLPEAVWNMPPLGTINLHASLLPQYRGAAPINWTIINGESETGVTTFFISHQIDTGDIILNKKVPVGPDESAGELHDKLMSIGAEALVETIELIRKGDPPSVPQKDLFQGEELREAPKIFKQDCRIDWQRSLNEIYNFIRGLSPYPAAWTELQSPEGDAYQLKIFRALKEQASHNLSPGNIITDGKSYVKVAVAGGYINIHELQLAGKRRMNIEEFLRGFNIKDRRSVQ